MFSNLPNEILIPIFLQLHQNDQLECMRVCHHWNQVISSSTLYHSVFIYSFASMKKLIEIIQQRPTIASKIERLMIRTFAESDNTIDADNSCLLLSLLSNLKILYCNTDVFKLNKKAKYPWCNQIQYIYEDIYGSTSGHFLLFNACPNLTTLRIKYVEHDFLSLVKNAPALTNLTLDRVSFNFAQLELIHKHLPHLQFFKITDLDQLNGSSPTTDVITPATSVTEFVVNVNKAASYLNRPVVLVDLLRYISRKYSNLSSLTFRFYVYELTLDSTKGIIEDGWIPLMQRLGPQLKNVCLSFPEYRDDFFEKLDQFSCKPHYLSLDRLSYGVLTKIAHSQQMMSIQTLNLGIEKCGPFDWLKDLCVLKKLILIYWVHTTPSTRIHITDILSHSPPTLETLSLCTSALVVDLDYAGISNIKSLSLLNVTLYNDRNMCIGRQRHNGRRRHNDQNRDNDQNRHNDQNDHRVGSFLSRCFPRLSTLKLRQCNILKGVLNLETLDLVRFHYYDDKFYTDKKTVLVHTLGNNERRLYYVCNDNNEEYTNTLYKPFYPQNYLPVKSVPENEANGIVPDFTLVCHSVKDLVFTLFAIVNVKR